jgi:AP-2 complex subunit mu-1
MIGVVMVLGSRGDLVLQRTFRDNLDVRALADTFRLELIGTKRAERSPINIINRVAYLHMRFEQMYLVCCTHSDADAMAIFQYMIRLLQILYNYLDDGMSEAAVRRHFVTVQQVIDETLDYGFPQLTEVQLLRSFIALDGSDDIDLEGRDGVAVKKRTAQQITVRATGAIPWRADNIAYSTNEMFVDVLEDINLLLSATGAVLQCEVAGRIVVRSFLSGMPQCSVALNDRQIVASALASGEQASSAAAASASAATAGGGNGEGDGPAGFAAARERRDFALDDCSFHQCVRLSALEAEKAINFIPPDGEFILMRYRTTNSIEPPFRVINSHADEISRSRFEVGFHLKSTLAFEHAATEVRVTVPTPRNVANVNVRVNHGKAKFDAAKCAIVWKIPRVQGAVEMPFSAEVQLLPSTLDSERAWTRPPVVLAFTIGGLAMSGIKLVSLRVEEPKVPGYDAKKWVRYISSAGQYQIRLKSRNAGILGV